MPYVRKKNVIYKKTRRGKLKRVGKSRAPRKYLRVLRALERGWRPKK